VDNNIIKELKTSLKKLMKKNFFGGEGGG